MQPSLRNRTSAGGSGMRVAALTMARDESEMLARWVQFYGDELGLDNLIVLDDNSVDGSARSVPCTVIHLPPGPWTVPWSKARLELCNGITRSLLAVYDAVIVTDVDEFLIPDPARYRGLLHYLRVNRLQDVIAPLALNVLHDARVEPMLDPSKPVMEQRRYVKFVSPLCKPMIKRVPAEWVVAGLHGIEAPFKIDPDLIMLHLKFSDLSVMQALAQRRQDVYEKEGRGGPASTWPLGPDDLSAKLNTWADPRGAPIQEFDPSELDLEAATRVTPNGVYRTVGSQVRSMNRYPLRQLPERFRTRL